MFKNLDSTDKKILSIGLWTTAILGLTVLVNANAIDSYLIDRATPNTSSITTTTVNPPATPEVENDLSSDAIASVSISDNANGTADIYIDLAEPSQLTGAELYFSVDGQVLGASIDCSDEFDCVGSDISDESISIYAFRPLDQVETELSGKIKVATFTFDPISEAILTTNDVRVTKLLVTALGVSENLADPTVRSYTIGD